MDFANKENEEEIDADANDVEEAMLDVLVDDEDDADLVVDDPLIEGVIPPEIPIEVEEKEEEEEAEDEENLFEDDAEDVDFDSFDDVDHL